LWVAVKDNKIKTIKDLLSRKAFEIDDIILPKVGHTILHDAVILNRFEMFRMAMIYKGIYEKSFILKNKTNL
jgi:hypothetical protein